MQIYVLYIHCIYDNGIIIHDRLALNNNNIVIIKTINAAQYCYFTVMIL